MSDVPTTVTKAARDLIESHPSCANVDEAISQMVAYVAAQDCSLDDELIAHMESWEKSISYELEAGGEFSVSVVTTVATGAKAAFVEIEEEREARLESDGEEENSDSV